MAQSSEAIARAPQKLTDEDPRRVVLQRRCTELGWNPSQDKLLAAARQMCGTAEGRAMVLGLDQDTARKSWDAYNGWKNAQDRHAATCLGISPYPEVRGLEVEPEPFEVDAETECDTRTEDERHRDAKNAAQRWDDYFRQLPLGQQSVLQSMRFGWIEPVRNGSVTRKGRLFLVAAEKLADVVENS